MGDSNNSDNSEKKRGGPEMARRIWLAGIGAYGRAFSEAQGALKDVTGGTGRVFDDLVRKGEMIEKAVETKGRDLMGKVPSMPSVNMDERIAKMRARLKRGEDVADDLSRVEARLDAVEAKLDKVLDALIAKKAPAKKTAAKKTAARKTATRKTPTKKS